MKNALGRTEVTVRFAETDQQGVAYHANYFVWMDVGRTALLRDLGFPYGELEARGLLFAVTEASCRYQGAARYDEVVSIETQCREVRSRAVVFEYRIAVGERDVASGTTTLVALDPNRRLRRIPDLILTALRGV